jgi:uncharacterized membrane protein
MDSELRAAYRILAALLALSSAACSDGASGAPRSAQDAGAPLVSKRDCSTLEPVPTFEDLQRGILQICHRCHSAQVSGAARNGAPDGVNFDTYEEFKVFADTASFLVEKRVMPFPDGGGPTEAQRRELYAWAACGTPP